MTSIRLGIVGLGRGFMLTLPALLSDPRICLAAAFDLRRESRERFALQFDAIAFESFEALLASEQVDAVYIATPHELHAEQAIAALNSGKHVLVEKPMAANVADCVRMEKAARLSDRVLVVGPSHRFDAPVLTAADMVRSGEFGAVRMVTALNFTDFMFRPRRPEELDTARGGGVVYSQATHQIDVVRQIVGRPVSTIRAITGNWYVDRPSEGAYAALMNFEGGVSASLTYSGYAHYDSDELVDWISELGHPKNPEAYGDARRKLAGLSPADEMAAKLSRAYGAGTNQDDPKPAPYHEHFGFILVSCERADLKLSPKGIAVYGDVERRFLDIAPLQHPRAEVLTEFVDAIAQKCPSTFNARWGVETMACCAALLESSRTGRDVAPSSIIDRIEETFTP